VSYEHHELYGIKRFSFVPTFNSGSGFGDL